MRLSGKTYIITGAAGGMGKVTVDRFIEEGANVVACDLSVASLSEKSNNFLTVEGDLTKEEQAENVVAQAIQAFGKLDGLVHIAGIAQKSTPIEDVTLDEWNRIITINTTAVFLMNRAVVKALSDQEGVIVNVASISTVRPRPGLSSYIASKGAAVSFSQALAIELAPKKVRVNVIHPGPSDTQMLGQFAAEGADVDKMKDSVFKQSVPLGKLIEPIDIANAAVYLCSDEARMVTGTVLHVDGGRGL
ncbi:SDR family NAD(P)-dependent oxidoreductase [Sutcliffiella cohnii]